MVRWLSDEAVEMTPHARPRRRGQRVRVAGRVAAVRGVVIVEQFPESVGYEAAGVSDFVSFRSVRVSLTFQTIDV